MFGKREWFSVTKEGLGLRPASWQGWAYSGISLVVLALPFLLLLQQAKVVEAIVWAGTVGGLLYWDVRQLRASTSTSSEPNAPVAASRDDEDVFVIDENETESARFATRNFDLRYRR